MKASHTHPFLSGTILAKAFLAASAAQSVAGESTLHSISPSAPIAEHNPLSFFDGALVFDFEERFRWEIRENNFDFNDSVNALTDDNWFLQRMRFGMTVKPAPWMKVYVQAQDSREINSDRPDFPGALGAEGDDAFGQNLHDLEVSMKAQPLKTVSLKAELHAFWLATTDDAWYRANGVAQVRPLNAVGRNADSYAGSEIDLTATWNVNKHLQVEGGYSHFFAGDYLSDTGASDDADFGYIQAKLTF